jgi:DNA-binding MarR family transcriptional regulator
MARHKNLRRIEQAMVELNRTARSGKGDAARSGKSGVSIPGAAQRVLYQISENGSVRMADLARRTQTDPGIMTRQVDLLEREGLVERKADPGDRRAMVVRMTPKGRRAAVRLRAVQDEIFERLLTDWAAGDLERAAEIMERLVHDLRSD